MAKFVRGDRVLIWVRRKGGPLKDLIEEEAVILKEVHPGNYRLATVNTNELINRQEGAIIKKIDKIPLKIKLPTFGL